MDRYEMKWRKDRGIPRPPSDDIKILLANSKIDFNTIIENPSLNDIGKEGPDKLSKIAQNKDQVSPCKLP